jgi:hypothetical protein
MLMSQAAAQQASLVLFAGLVGASFSMKTRMELGASGNKTLIDDHQTYNVIVAAR